MSEDFPALAGFRAGSLVAGYRLEAQVGAGGMAVVFRARDERLGRLVALKILAPALAADSAFRRRFIAESRAAAAVDDPHIIPVYEAGEAGGVLFIAMRFVVGGDLRGVLEREGPLAPGRAAWFISPVASALDAAHRAGLVHRDVKPANILVDAREDQPDHVYLSDFGVSKGAMSSVSLTGTGQFLGTPDYSAPEQIQGLAVDGQADQYALACVTYQLLTGAVPFERDQGLAVLLAHLSEPPPSLASRRPGLPGAADQVLARALAKAPENRYGSCRDFADALRDALRLAPYTSPGSAATPGHPHTEIASHPGFPGPATAGTGTGTAAGPADPAAAETIDSVPRGGQASTADVPAAAATVTRPGDRLNEGIPVLRPGPGTGGSAEAAPPAAGAGRPPSLADVRTAGQHVRSGPGLGSDGAQPARRPRRRLLTIALACAILAVAGVVPFVLARSPGSPRSPGSSTSTSPGGGSSPAVTATIPVGSQQPLSVAVSPDGQHAYAGGFGTVSVINTASNTVIATIPVGIFPTGVAVSPDGQYAYVTNATTGTVSVIDTATDTVTATITAGSAAFSVAVAPDGDYAYVANLSDGTVSVINTASNTATTALTVGSHPFAVAFAPDGRYAYVTDADSNSVSVISTASNTVTATVPLISPAGVAFAPDGRHAYITNRYAKTVTVADTGTG